MLIELRLFEMIRNEIRWSLTAHHPGLAAQIIPCVFLCSHAASIFPALPLVCQDRYFAIRFLLGESPHLAIWPAKKLGN
jgi:hypothetical protein